MAVNESRSMNTELREGQTDQMYKKTPSGGGERGGIIDPATHKARIHLSDQWYGVNTEAVSKVTPDGKLSH